MATINIKYSSFEQTKREYEELSGLKLTASEENQLRLGIEDALFENKKELIPWFGVTKMLAGKPYRKFPMASIKFE